MAHIIWCGNKKWDEIFNGDQPWDKEISEKDIPEKAVFLDRPDDIVRASVPYMIVPCIICFAAVLIKKRAVECVYFQRLVYATFVFNWICYSHAFA